MVDGPTRERWAELRSRRPVSEDALATLSLITEHDGKPMMLAMDAAGDLHLLISLHDEPPATTPSDLNGLKVRHRRLETGEVLDLMASPAYEGAFNAVCQDVIEAIAVQRRDPWPAVTSIIRAWQSAWRPARAEMGKTVQVGLFGELLVLQEIMMRCLGSAAVAQWSGPDSERHDFAGNLLHIEVKTTRKSRHEHEISRLDQLRVPPGCQLLLVSIQLEESVAGRETVATRMDAIIDQLRSDAAALDDFMTKMVDLGWSDDMRYSGELLRFFIRAITLYAVDEEFPRLPDDFAPPSGVVAVKYTIDLANLAALGVDEVHRIINDANSSNG